MSEARFPISWVAARDVFFGWEKLRIFYNGALAAVTFATTQRALYGESRFWLAVVFAAIGANVCFFAGPVAEVYFTWLGLPRRIVRPALLIAGTAFACWLAYEILRPFGPAPAAG